MGSGSTFPAKETAPKSLWQEAEGLLEEWKGSQCVRTSWGGRRGGRDGNQGPGLQAITRFVFKAKSNKNHSLKDVKPGRDKQVPIFIDHSGYCIENKSEGSKSKAHQSEGCMVSR